MRNVLLVFLGGGLGSVARYLTVLSVTRWLPQSQFPWGVFIANILGSFILGFLCVWPMMKTQNTAVWLLLHVLLKRRLAHRVTGGVQPVGHDAQVGDGAARRQQQAAQRVAVAVVDGPGLQRLARHDEFVAGGEQRHPRTPQHRQRGRPHRSGQAERLRRQPRTGLQHHRPVQHVFAAAADPLAIGRHGVHPHPSQALRQALDGFLPKPILPETLREVLAKVLQRI